MKACRAASPDALAGLFLFAATLLFYYPLVFLGRALIDFDAFVYFYPQRAYLGSSLLEGRLPLWNPYLFSGAPFLANPQTAVLYPPSWLFALGPVHYVYTAQLVLHTLLAAGFTYLFVRLAFGVHPLAALVGGLAYGMGGFAVGQVGHLNQLSAAAWVPAVLLAYDRFVTTRSPAWIAAGAAALGLQLLAGHPQETYMTILILGLFGLARAPWSQPRRMVEAAIGGVVISALGALLAAAQLLPTLELIPLSIRGAGVEWRDAVAGSLPQYLAVRALFPPFWIDVPNTEYLGYAGAAPVALGLLAVVVARGRWVAFGAALCFFGLFFALGEFNGMYAGAFEHVPGIQTFRVPARWLLLWQFGVAVLAALGADWIVRGAGVWLKRGVLIRATVIALVIMSALAWQLDYGEPFAQRRTPLLWLALGGAALATGVLANVGMRGVAGAALVVITAAELFAAADASPARRSPIPVWFLGDSINWLLDQGADEDGSRSLSLARPEYIPNEETPLRRRMEGFSESIIQSLVVTQKWNDTLTPNIPMQYGLASADGYDGGVLPLLRWLELTRLAVPSPRPDGVLLSRLEELPSERTLDLFGVQYLLASGDTPPRADLDMYELGDLRMFSRRDALPVSRLVFSAAGPMDDSEALARLRVPIDEPSTQVLLATGQPAPSAPMESSRAPEAVEPEVRAPERWRARVTVPEPAYLVQREAWYPGWRARVDGVEVPVLRADVLYRAVQLAPGEHVVELWFEPASFQRGALLTAIGIIVCLALTLWGAVRTRVRIMGPRAPHRLSAAARH